MPYYSIPSRSKVAQGRDRFPQLSRQTIENMLPTIDGGKETSSVPSRNKQLKMLFIHRG
jgi:hypothetical protein